MAHFLDKDGLQRFFNGLKNVFALKSHTHTTVNGHTVESDVPSGAKFTDTVYTHPSYTARTGKPTANVTPGFGDSVTVSQITSDATGHVTGATDRTITIPSTAASQSAAGLMSADDKKAVDNSVRVFSRSDIGTAPNFDNPGVNGLFEVRNSTETPSATGTRPVNGYLPMLSAKSPDNTVIMQLAASKSAGFFIRGHQAANVTLADVPWARIATSQDSGTGDNNGQVKIAGTNVNVKGLGALAYKANLSPDLLTAGYIRNAVYISHHPGGTGKATFPFLYNDLAHLVRRGGAYTVYTTTATDYTPGTIASTAVSTDLTNAFDGSPSYALPNRAQTDKLVIDITCPQMFTYSNVFYIDFGSDNWRAKSINVLVMNANTETTYTQKAAVTNWAWGHYQVTGLSHTSTNTSGTTVQGFNRLRIVLTDFANTQNRIAQIGIINYGSAGVRVPYMSRGVDDDVYRSIHPATSGTYSLGTSSKKWADGYFTTLYGSGANLTSLNGSNISSGTVAAARIASLDASKIGSGTFDAARLPAASTTAQGAMSADDKVKLNGIAAGAQVNTITGVKGNAESSYRTGNVNLTAANIGAAAATHSHAASDISSGTLDAARIPSLDASKIGSGTLASARLPAASTTAQGAMSAADKTKLDGLEKGLYIDMGTISSLPVTKTFTGVTTDMVVARMELGTPSAQRSDWTVNTDTADSITISGTISGSTTCKLLLVQAESGTAS